MWSITWRPAVKGKKSRPLGAFFSFIEITDEDNSIAAMYQAVGELPQANRDTLAFLMIHLQRFVQQKLVLGIREFSKENIMWVGC